MSTRATIHFHYPHDSKPEAIIYRHGDGYPEGLGQDLQHFVADLKANLKDNRFDDASYLAAKWVVWDARNHQAILAKAKVKEAKHPCDFTSIGVCKSDPDDIKYRYTVTCDGEPTIKCERPDGKPVSIPPLKN